MIKGRDAQRALADKAYASKENHADLRGKHRGGILYKAVRGRPLCPSQKRFNKLIPKQRFGVEQCFGTMQRLFGLPRVRYFGATKTHAQMAMAALSQPLLKATNTITFNRKTSTIAERKPKTQIRPLKSQRTAKHLWSNREGPKTLLRRRLLERPYHVDLRAPVPIWKVPP